MIDGDRIADELRRSADRGIDTVLRRAVERVHERGERYDWVGVYLLEGDELALHNFIGQPTEHERIPVGQGVCGTAVAEDRDINVPDVSKIDNYLACSRETRSEIVVLIRSRGRVIGQIDIDSDTPAAFGEGDERELRKIADALGEVLAERSLGDDQ